MAYRVAMTARRTLWIDATAGIAGDMVVAALVDAHDDPALVQRAVERAMSGLVPEVHVEWTHVSRNGFRALRYAVSAVDQAPERHLGQIRELLAGTGLAPAVAEMSRAVVERLVAAEAGVHGMPIAQVHLHEVGAWDSLADVVGACVALAALEVDQVMVSPIEVGSGVVVAAHGELPVPPPGVLELARGWVVQSTGTGELATPTGVALATTWAGSPAGSAAAPGAGQGGGQGPLPAGRVLAVGVGAGSVDRPGRANVVRVVVVQHPIDEDPIDEDPIDEDPIDEDPIDQDPIDQDPIEQDPIDADPRDLPDSATLDPTAPDPWATDHAADHAVGLWSDATRQALTELSANVDDLDPRAWPSVLQALLAAGALDAWLTPILMKKGRPAHTVHALVARDRQVGVTEVLARHTTSFGVRAAQVSRVALARGWVPVAVLGIDVAVKIAHADGRILHATPEADDVVAVAARLGLPVREVLTAATVAAAALGLRVGEPVPSGLSSERPSR